MCEQPLLTTAAPTADVKGARPWEQGGCIRTRRGSLRETLLPSQTSTPGLRAPSTTVSTSRPRPTLHPAASQLNALGPAPGRQLARLSGQPENPAQLSPRTHNHASDFPSRPPYFSFPFLPPAPRPAPGLGPGTHQPSSRRSPQPERQLRPGRRQGLRFKPTRRSRCFCPRRS